MNGSLEQLGQIVNNNKRQSLKHNGHKVKHNGQNVKHNGSFLLEFPESILGQINSIMWTGPVVSNLALCACAFQLRMRSSETWREFH